MTISSIDAALGDNAPTRATDIPAISAVGVSKRYGSVTALDRLTLDIRRGEVFGLLGPNGSGKTTFMRLLAGYLLPSAGRLTVAGLDTVRDSLAVRRRIGYVPESAPLYRQMRVGEFLAFMARLRGLPERAVAAAVERVVDRLGRQHTMLLSTHILSEVEKTSDRVAVMLDGRLLGVQAMADTPDLESWFLSLT